ncbi:Uma2 family endonuclease [Trichocoleus sp. FACHB-90]|uniref:Uma2 family endonuclease n=1 Tax=Cyanophyceae TaxID=3028117 RepID=UPI00168844F0|nr:Uma2 family endonuclease [Trichocoleus sp. FACHB-90]MBD1927968.1 Uma2 family endonuclease [Trichocoleus sp. FACHB-90]
MTTTTQPKLNFEQYLNYDDGTDNHYELVGGQLKLMNPPTLLHIRIAKFLERQFDSEIERLGYTWEAFREVGQQTEEDSARLPDVLVVPLELAETLMNQSAVLRVPSLLVVEIVSPSSKADDYKEKLEEYQKLGIPEYWIVNPESKRDKRVTVHQLQNQVYQKQEFRGSQRIISATFPELNLTAEQVLRAKL